MTALSGEYWRWREFPSREALAETLAAEVASTLAQAAENSGRGLLAVSGGSTPALFFEHLAHEQIPWNAMVVTLCDERFVPPSSPRSNEGLVRRSLLQGPAAAARFVPLFHKAPDIESAAEMTAVVLTALPLALDIAVLGMGEDGHTASFFPDAVELDSALDRSSDRLVMVIHAPSGGEARLTLTLPPLVAARRLMLHIEGSAKRSAFERAVESEPPLPIRRVIETAKNPVEVFWAP